MADDLREDERPVQDQRNDGDERELAPGEHGPGHADRVVRQDERQHDDRGQRRERCADAVEPEALLAEARAAQEQAQADHAGQDDHHGGEHRIAGERRRRGTAGQHQRNDQRDFDHRDRDGQHQRAERLADAMRDDLGVMHRRQHAADQSGRDEHQVRAAEARAGFRRTAARRRSARRWSRAEGARHFSFRDYNGSSRLDRELRERFDPGIASGDVVHHAQRRRQALRRELDDAVTAVRGVGEDEMRIPRERDR